jgi:LmbE family N-acetylglucosaminyl deacetylase
VSQNVLIVAAHPDDEVLGCAGVAAKHAAAGDKVFLQILAEGSASRFSNSLDALESVMALRSSAHRAAKVMGATDLELLRFPDNQMDTVPQLDVNKAVELAVDRWKPTVVYTHHAYDLNVDHRIVHEAVLTACRPLPTQTVREIYCFEVASSTEWQMPGPGAFTPQMHVDISAYWEIKKAALACYESEMRPWPHPRSMEGLEYLARIRGAAVGCSAAEAFMVARLLR